MHFADDMCQVPFATRFAKGAGEGGFSPDQVMECKSGTGERGFSTDAEALGFGTGAAWTTCAEANGNRDTGAWTICAEAGRSRVAVGWTTCAAACEPGSSTDLEVV